MWVFGLVEARPLGRRKLFFVYNRDAPTLGQIIQQNVEPGSLIDHDGLGAYDRIPWSNLGL